MTRLDVENEIIKLIKAVVGDDVTVGPMPLGSKVDDIYRFKAAAVWVAYEGCSTKPNRTIGVLSQQEEWFWSVLVLSRNYRSADAAHSDALHLLETVIGAVAGSRPGQGCPLFNKKRDGLVFRQDRVDVVAYEAVFSLQTYLRR